MPAENSHFPFPTNITVVPETTLVIRDDYTIFIGPDGVGNDTIGNGTDTKPYATLKKAWERAGEILIRGNATLYIRFQSGFYNITNPYTFFPNNLFHPNGDRIIIEGDPAHIKQHYLYWVENYNWDYSKYSHYGHTGDVRLFSRSGSGSGSTAHGFTGSDATRVTDIGRYVAISNPALSSPYFYNDSQNGIYAGRYRTDTPPHDDSSYFRRTVDSYADVWYSHGLSHDHALGIVGLATIIGATASPHRLSLSFKNSNRDPRVPSFTDSGGGKIKGNINGIMTLFTHAANLPPAQQYSPSGYYGANYASGTIDNKYTVYPSQYPANPSVNHITDDPMLLTSYPVILRINRNYTGNDTATPGISPIRVSGGKIKAIRNLMFVDEMFDGASAGAQNFSFGFSGVHMVTYTGERHTPPCFLLDGSEVGIRHIGIQGFGDRGGAAIVLKNSKLSAYSDWIEYGNTIGNNVTDEHTQGRPAVFARLGSQNNTPVLMINGIRRGIVADNSELSLTVGSATSKGDANTGISPFFSGFHSTDESVWVQTHAGPPLEATNSRCSIGSGIFLNKTQYPSFRLGINLPRFSGLTLSTGNTTGIYSPQKWQSLDPWNYGPSFNSVVMYADGVTVGRIVGTYYSGENSSTTTFGSSTEFFPSGAGSAGAINVYFYGVRFGDPSLINSTANLNTYLSQNKKIELVGFSNDSETTRTTSKLVIEGLTVGVTTDNGTGLQLRKITQNSAISEFSFLNLHGAKFSLNSKGTYDSTVILNNSTLTLHKNMIVSGGACGVLATNNSKLQTHKFISSRGLPYSCIMGEFFTDSCLLAEHGSVISVPSLFTRHPDIIGLSGRVASVSSEGVGSVIDLDSTSILVSPTRASTTVNFWTGLSAIRGIAVSPVSATKAGTVSFGSVVPVSQYSPKVLILSDSAVYADGTITEECKDTGLFQMYCEFGGQIAPLETVPTSSIGANSSTSGRVRTIGWSGPNSSQSYRLQVCQTDQSKRFYNVSSTGQMYRFWTHPLGSTSSTATANTVFYGLPVMIDGVGADYGASSTIATDSSSFNYSTYVVKPSIGTNRGYSGSFVFFGPNGKGGVFPYQVY